jgi:hypothetical protein
MANDRPPVRGEVAREIIVLQVRFLVAPAREKMSDVGDKSPRHRLDAATMNLSQAAGLLSSCINRSGLHAVSPTWARGKRTQLNDQRSLSTTKNSRNFRSAGSTLDKTEIRTLLLGGGGFAVRAEQTCLTADSSDMSDVAQCHKDFLNILLIYCNNKLHSLYLCSY